jgi:hypothetical protein
MRPALIVPAYNAQGTIVGVLRDLSRACTGAGGPAPTVFVVDDGSTDGTADVVTRRGVKVIRHAANRGKGAAIRTGLLAALEAGCDVVVTVDADGQHAPEDAAALLDLDVDPRALVLGVRDLGAAGAPLWNVLGNRLANFSLSILTLLWLRDTQCGLRRYPVASSLALRSRDDRFGFESEIILRAARAALPIVQVPVRCAYALAARQPTHYRRILDTVRIIARLHLAYLVPWLRGPRTQARLIRPRPPFGTRARQLGSLWVGAVVLLLALLLARAILLWSVRMRPPVAAVAAFTVVTDPSDPAAASIGRDYVRHRGRILEVGLAGTPEEIGAHHTALLHPFIVANQAELWSRFASFVPAAAARQLLLDWARVRFHALDRDTPDWLRREVAASASVFAPDPWQSRIPTYDRLIYLGALYDIALSFEDSPLVGCTSFALTGAASADGHTMLARNFDLEAGRRFDDDKAVFLVRMRDRLAYASVAWPGLIGVLTGMNEAGVALVVHGGRARTPRSQGAPIAATLREVLGEARDTRGALAALARRDPMVAHFVFIADAQGDVAVVERAPGEPAFVRRGGARIGLTNHFEGPLADDPRNARVERETTTLARRQRLDELLAALPDGAVAPDAVRVLRDRRAAGGAPLLAGDRRAIDASIATHAVVMDATARVLWVNEGPHLDGRFVRFDLGRLLAPDYDPSSDRDVVALP